MTYNDILLLEQKKELSEKEFKENLEIIESYAKLSSVTLSKTSNTKKLLDDANRLIERIYDLDIPKDLKKVFNKQQVRTIQNLILKDIEDFVDKNKTVEYKKGQILKELTKKYKKEPENTNLYEHIKNVLEIAGIAKKEATAKKITSMIVESLEEACAIRTEKSVSNKNLIWLIVCIVAGLILMYIAISKTGGFGSGFFEAIKNVFRSGNYLYILVFLVGSVMFIWGAVILLKQVAIKLYNMVKDFINEIKSKF